MISGFFPQFLDGPLLRRRLDLWRGFHTQLLMLRKPLLCRGHNGMKPESDTL
jgi:hypothetical protein